MKKIILPALRTPPLSFEEIKNHIAQYISSCWPKINNKHYENESYLRFFQTDALYEIEHVLNDFINTATKYAKVWDCVGDYVVFLARQGRPLPEKLAEFIKYQITHPKKKPKHKGTDPLENLAFKRMLLIGLCYAKKLGAVLTRNDVSDEQSACDIVAEAASKATKMDIGYDSIRKLRDRNVQDYKTLLKSVELEFIKTSKSL